MGVKSHAVVKGRKFYCNRDGLFQTTSAVVELQPSLLHRLGDGPEFPIDKDLTEFYQQNQWMAKATKLKLPKQAQLSNRPQNVEEPVKAEPNASLQTRW